MKICDQFKKTFKLAMKTIQKGDVVIVNPNAKQLAGRKVTVTSAEKDYDQGRYVVVKDSGGEYHKIDVGLLRKSATKSPSKKKPAPVKAAPIIRKERVKTTPKKAATKKTAPKKVASKAGTVCVKLFNEEDTKDGIKAAKALMKKDKKLTYRAALSKTMRKEYPRPGK